MSFHSTQAEGFSLLEMIADPGIQSEMVRDGATKAELEGLFGGSVPDKMISSRSLIDRNGQRETSSTRFGK